MLVRRQGPEDRASALSLIMDAAIKIFIVFSLLLFGCRPSYYQFEYRLEGRGIYINNVPFFPQEENYCGPAALASVLNFYGYKATQQDIAKEIFTPRLKGTITVEMAGFARRAGFGAAYYKGGIENIKAEIDKGHPLILYIKTGYLISPSGHYITVVGYDDTKEGVIAYSGRDKDIFISYKKLMKDWGKTGYWTLLILPYQVESDRQ